MSAERLTARVKRIGLSLALLVILLGRPVAGAAAAFHLVGLDGTELGGAQVSQGVTIAVVWASWSPRCRDVGVQANGLVERWSGRARVVTVNFQEEKDAARIFAEEQDLRAPVYLDPDGEFAKAFGVTNLPGLLVLRDGQVAYSGKFPPDVDKVLSEHVP